MGKYFYNELDTLKNELIKMTNIIEAMAEDFTLQIDKPEKEILQKNIAYDAEVDRLELEIEEQCISIIALYQPVAKDLRRTATVLKMITDIERMGDYYVDIFEILGKLEGEQDREALLTLKKMGVLIQEMIHKSVDSFIDEDEKLAEEIALKDDLIDGEYMALYNRLLERLLGDFNMKENTIKYLLIGRYLERIADHNTNICERVIYMINGKKVQY